MEKIKELVDQGVVELATLNGSNPEQLDYSTVKHRVDVRNQLTSITSTLAQFTPQQRKLWISERKEAGNSKYTSGDYNDAIKTYLQALMGLDLKEKEEKEELQYPILLNIATCYYHLEEYAKGVAICDTILKERSSHEMGLFKKGCLLTKMGEYQAAAACFREAGKTESNSLRQSINLQLKIVGKHQQEQCSMYKKMFVRKIEEEEDESMREQQVEVEVEEGTKSKDPREGKRCGVLGRALQCLHDLVVSPWTKKQKLI